ncbi:hypothetical protein [Mucilaginibacter paludis]|uniref:Lipoprotein n=1 Tax=Mucilaginibacter paludis DSM 18603 TaxID=714943 RepID=H1YEB2_9SPHI|nr:hypothetical protein [Mucilaginibacter paludis]EHQ26175.1 hypothetical protein Mucpa_2035 [Mucilaginibacter paludis DSM 18603]
MELVFKTTFTKNVGLALIAVLFIFLFGCHSQPDFNGTYVNHASGEFSIADDTLQVEHVQGQQYTIHRKTGYREIAEDGKPSKLQWHVEEWQAVYDPGARVMTESRKGRTLTFGKGILVLERSRYRRVN